jgi:hypothetical protein
VTTVPALISRLARHLTQYPSNSIGSPFLLVSVADVRGYCTRIQETCPNGLPAWVCAMEGGHCLAFTGMNVC